MCSLGVSESTIGSIGESCDWVPKPNNEGESDRSGEEICHCNVLKKSVCDA